LVQSSADIHSFWQEQSFESLWDKIGDNWPGLIRLQIVILVASYDDVGIPASEIAQLTGIHRDLLPLELDALVRDGVLVNGEGKQPRYRVHDRGQFLRYMRQTLFDLGVTAGHLSSLAGWAM
jgi:hypothetical protein